MVSHRVLCCYMNSCFALAPCMSYGVVGEEAVCEQMMIQEDPYQYVG